MTTTAPATRSRNGVDLPVAGVWALDPGHTEVGFVGRHFMLTRVRGRFTGVEGQIEIAEDPSESRLDVTIDMTTVNSGDDARDEHLRSDDLFDVASHPTATFRSTAVDWDGANGTVRGDLTLVGVTKEVVLDVEYLGHATDPWGNERAIFSASTELDREEWGLTWNMVLETGGLMVSKRIRLEIETETILQRHA